MYKNVVSPIIGGCGLFVSVVLENPVYQLIIFILSVIGLLVNLFVVITKWFLEAKKDGKITLEEIQKLNDEINNLKKE